MFGLKLDKSVRIVDIITIGALLSAGWGMYYNTQSRIDAEKAERLMADKEAMHAVEKASSDMTGLSASVVEVVKAVEKLRDGQTDMRIELERVKARSGS